MKKKYPKYLLPYDEKTRYDIIRGVNNVIINSKDELKYYIFEALIDNKSNKNIHLGIIPNQVILKVKKDITDIKKEKIDVILDENINYDLIIKQKEIRHLKKESLSLNDINNLIMHLDKIVCAYDTVRYCKYNNNQHALRFQKRMFKIKYIGLEIISNKKRTFRTLTIFFDKKDFINKKRRLSLTLNE